MPGGEMPGGCSPDWWGCVECCEASCDDVNGCGVAGGLRMQETPFRVCITSGFLRISALCSDVAAFVPALASPFTSALSPRRRLRLEEVLAATGGMGSADGGSSCATATAASGGATAGDAATVVGAGVSGGALTVCGGRTPSGAGTIAATPLDGNGAYCGCGARGCGGNAGACSVTKQPWLRHSLMVSPHSLALWRTPMSPTITTSATARLSAVLKRLMLPTKPVSYNSSYSRRDSLVRTVLMKIAFTS
mmetsp:Transcript_8914/g.14944  ORF Transcript_8914/g.14944 Transcript_8914/m.14944 type:complete len:249 (+) Transcript_8914:1421-2167(+)